ncbi:hypothetical protein D9611_012684 [Ephemerocybe angulata]|uniref:Uncharacterized protein n=1 Tax=Ephemerocybe angulata TaxID=980116 RepID=A0A8H5BBB1_9AGAR|nr:hypothetical protein D9611_012684 [Tulosesus angulatus]
MYLGTAGLGPLEGRDSPYERTVHVFAGLPYNALISTSKTAIHTSRESQDAITKIRLPAAVPSSKKKSAKSTVQKPTQSCLAPNFQIPPLPQPLISSVPSSSTKRKLDDITNLNTVHLASFTHNNSLDLSLGDSDSDSDDNTQCENPRNVVALPSTTLTTGSQSNFLEDTADRGLAAA